MFSWLTTALAEQFESVRLLGDSPRGRVELLRHRSAGQQVVCRRFHGDAAPYRKLLEVSHPNLPRVLEVSEQEGETLVLEEFIPGDDLGTVLRRRLFSPREASALIVQLCDALWALHSLNIIHRDVKPENIILSGDRLKLIDLDAARSYKPGQSRDTRVLGTVGFAAPEQFGLTQSDHRADLYAAGVLLNVLITGEHPCVRLCPRPLDKVVTRCTMIDAERRYPSALRLKQALLKRM